MIWCSGFQSAAINHNIHLAQVNIKNIPQSTFSSVEIKMFADDFRDALQNYFPKKRFIANETLCEQHQQITKYITKHFYCKINQKKCKLVFQSCTFRDGMYALSFNFTTPRSWTSVKIKADFLMEIFPKQSNIISLNYNQEKWFERVQKGKETIEWEFQ